LGGFTEWKVLYYLCKDTDGFLHKDTVRAVYDGSLFERLEKEIKSKESTKKK
jgi:peroxygenase